VLYFFKIKFVAYRFDRSMKVLRSFAVVGMAERALEQQLKDGTA